MMMGLLLWTRAVGAETTMTVVRTLAGTVGPEGAHYQPGAEIEVTLSFTCSNPERVTSFTFQDMLPPEWHFVGGSLVADPMPYIAPDDGATGLGQY